MLPEIVQAPRVLSPDEILPPKKLVHATARLSPFTDENIKLTMPPGGSVADILRAMNLPAAATARIFVNGDLVTREQREAVIPKEGDVVAIRLIPASGSSFKQVLVMIAALAVAVALPALGVAALPTALAAGAVGLVGKLLIGSLVSPPSEGLRPRSAQTYTLSGNSNQLQPYAAMPRVYGTARVRPLLAAQPYTFTQKDPVTLVETDEYLVLVYNVGYGPLYISDLKIKDTPIENFNAAVWQVRYGYPDDSPNTILGRPVHVNDLNNILLDTSSKNTIGTGWNQQVTAPNATTLGVTFSFPKGLYTINDVGNQRALTVQIAIRYAIWNPSTGTTGPWVDRPTKSVTSASRFGGSSTAPLWASDQWDVSQGQYVVQCSVVGISWLPDSDKHDTFEGTTIWSELRSFASPAIPLFTKPGFAQIALRIKANFLLNGEVSDVNCIATSILPPIDKSNAQAAGWVYDFEKAGAGANYGLSSTVTHSPGLSLSINTVTGASDGAEVASAPIPVVPPFNQTDESGVSGVTAGETYQVQGWYKANSATTAGVRLRVFFSDHDNFAATDVGVVFTDIITSRPATTSWQNVRGTVTVPGDATHVYRYMRVAVAFWTQGTNNNVLHWDDMSCQLIDPDTGVADGVELLQNPSFNVMGPSGARLGAPVGNANPAAIFYDVLTGSANKRPVPVSQIDMAQLAVWETFCATNNYLFNGVIDTQGTLYDTLKLVCTAGRAAFHMKDGLYSVIIDQAQSVPVQHFTPRNSWGFKGTRTCIDLPQALRVKYIEPNNDWKQVEVVAYADGFSAVGPHTITQLDIILGDGSSSTYGYDFTNFDPGSSNYPVDPNSLLIQVVDPSGTVVDSATDDGAGGISNGSGSIRGNIDYRFADGTLVFSSTLPANYRVLATFSVAAGTVAATLYETLDETKFCADRHQAVRDGRFHLAQGIYRPDTYELQVDPENLVAQRGDLVVVNHDVPQWGLGAGRVVSVTTDGSGNATGVVIDELLTMDGAITDYIVRFRKSDGSSVLRSVTTSAGRTNTLTFNTPFAAGDATIPVAGDLCMFGRSQYETAQMLVMNIEMGKNLSATLTLVDYAPCVYTYENEAVTNTEGDWDSVPDVDTLA